VIRVLIVAPSARARHALESGLPPRLFEIAGSFATIQAAADAADSEADVLLVEHGGAPANDALEVLEETGVSREIPTVILLEEASPEDISALLRVGARAVLRADADPRQIAIALQATLQDLVVLARGDGLARSAGISRANLPHDLAEPLTAREREVLRLLASGLGNKEIGLKLQISEHTAKFHVASILGKLGASTRAEAVSLGMRHGLILL